MRPIKLGVPVEDSDSDSEDLYTTLVNSIESESFKTFDVLLSLSIILTKNYFLIKSNI